MLDYCTRMTEVEPSMRKIYPNKIQLRTFPNTQLRPRFRLDDYDENLVKAKRTLTHWM